jgi:hypothetical protein
MPFRPGSRRVKRPRLVVPMAAVLALLLPSNGVAQSEWAHSHVRFEYPISQQLQAMPVLTNLEQEPGMTEMMAPVGEKCNQTPPANHKRWLVKTSVMKPLASQAVLTGAMQHPYEVADVIAARNLSKPVPATALDRSEAVTIAHDAHLENDAIAVHGVILALGCEADGDVHIDLATSLKSPTCLVIEVPNPKDVGAQPGEEKAYLTSMWGPVRRRFTEIYDDSGETPTSQYDVTVVGQLYFDTDHMEQNDAGGGRGLKIAGRTCARNLWEVHSVLDMTERH